MYFKDLTQYNYLGRNHFPPQENTANVGWLSEDYEFETGHIDQALLTKLKEQPIVNLCRGFHHCEFCQSAIGNGEIHITHKGITYKAPQMIIHYIEEHDYVPPKEFLHALKLT